MNDSRAIAANNKVSIFSVLGIRNFRILWIGETISVLGDQFLQIALPWLVLQITGDALALGSVLAVSGFVRAGILLIGGAYVDRVSPRRVMLLSNILRMILLGAMAFLVWFNWVELWMLFVFAVLNGMFGAFFYPAEGAIVPQVVDREHLAPANSLVQGVVQLSSFIGPTLAGLVIALFASVGAENTAGVTDAAVGLKGIALALGIDGLTFFASVVALLMVQVNPLDTDMAEEDKRGSPLKSIGKGITFAFKDEAIRTIFIVIMLMNFLAIGIIAVGVPVLVDQQYARDAAAFGMIMSAFGGGSLLGLLLMGVFPKLSARQLQLVLLGGILFNGTGFVLLAFSNAAPTAAVIMFFMGISNGYLSILLVTWLQKRTPQQMMGRVMSLMMFASMGLGPLSQLVAGLLIPLSLTGVILGAGIGMLLVFLWGLFFSNIRTVARELAD